MRRTLVVAVSIIGLSGCAVIPAYVATNEPLHVSVDATRATRNVALPENAFVGVALSGGGARAANFSSAVLLELEQLGFLKHVSAISSVSGGSLAAAYYGLFGNDGSRWNKATVKEKFLVDFETPWIVSWFNPWNIWRYWITGFDRSDIMKDVFDHHLFGGRRFGDMGTVGPKILINSTSLPGVERFVFTDEDFAERLGSRLDTYRVSHAVMASGAFPGAFQNVTLVDFKRPGTYEHLFDGGPSDNLGVETLVEMVNQLRPSACLLFVVDAYPYQRGAGATDFDTRSLTDFFVDKNVAQSADVFLTLSRYRALERLGLTSRPGDVSWWIDEKHGCMIWHLTFQTIIRSPVGELGVAVRERLERLRQVNHVPTRYRLEQPSKPPEPPVTADQVQDLLFEAANYLIYDDGDSLTTACAWFRRQGSFSSVCPGR